MQTPDHAEKPSMNPVQPSAVSGIAQSPRTWTADIQPDEVPKPHGKISAEGSALTQEIERQAKELGIELPQEKTGRKLPKLFEKLSLRKKKSTSEFGKVLNTTQKYLHARHEAEQKGFSRAGVEALLKTRRAEKKQKRKSGRHKLLRRYLDLAGYEHVQDRKIVKGIFNSIIVLCLIATLALLVYASVANIGARNSVILLGGVWTGIFLGLVVLSFVALFVFLDLRIFNRTLSLEAVLPDFLQLVATNISAGMPIDQALWFAVRPRFGVLAKEIEDVAKSTIVGEDLGKALQRFSAKYESRQLKESVNLLLEGMSSGGEMSELLNKIAINIQETRIMRREMSSSVTTYVIFITFASVVAAPFLFGLSTALLDVIIGIMGRLDLSQGVGGINFKFDPKNVDINNFKIFCIVTLIISSFFTACIISVIRKGNIKEGIKYIPIFMVASVLLYLLANKILGVMTSSLLAFD